MKNRLDPVRWSPRRRSRLLRAGAVTLLLVLAAGVLLSGADGPPASTARCGSARSTPSARSHAASGAATIPPGHRGVPVRVAQAGVAGLVRPGDHVELAVARSGSDSADVLVRDAVVLRDDVGDSFAPESGSVVYLAMTESEARRVAAATPEARITITVRPG